MTRLSREERRMSLTAALWLSVFLLCVFQPVRGEKGRFYDELLWTKSRWAEYTLKFPYRAMLFSKPFQESTSQQEGDGRSRYLVDYVQSLEGGSFESTMLGGGYDDVVEFLLKDGRSPEEVAAEKEDHEGTESNPVVDIRMGVVGQNQDIGLVLDTILNDGKLVSDLVDCDVQQALNTILWPILGNWTLLSGREISDKELMDIGADVCKVEVPVAVLKDNTLMQIVIVRESSSLSDSFGGLLDGLDEDTLHQISTVLTLNQSLDAHVEKIAGLVNVEPRALKKSLKREFSDPQGTLKKSEQEQEYYLVMLTRHSQHLLQMEVDTIKASCSQVLRNENWRNAILGAQRSYARVAARAIDFSGMGSDSDFAADDDHDHDRNKPPKVNRMCVDYHPLCEYWARKGECNANPKYMVGTARTGQCRLSCGVCEKTDLEALPIDLSSKNAQMLEDAYMEILTSNMIQGCPHAVISDDVNLRESLGAILRNHSNSLTSVSEQIQRVIGPISIKMFTPSTLSDNEEESSRGTEISMVSAHAKAVVALPSDSKSYPDLVKPTHLDPESKDPQTLLWEVLNDRCIYSFQGYWNYQLCYGISVQQYHVEAPQGKPEWVISLGDLKSAPQWDIVQRNSALYESKEIPAVVQEYIDGNECTVEDEYDEAFDAGRPSHRKSVVYFMCSPDSNLHMTTDEGTRCLYTIEVYIPDLCESDQLAVNSSPQDDGDGATVDPDDSRHSDTDKYKDVDLETSEVLDTEYAEEEEEEDEYSEEEDAVAAFEDEMTNHDEL